MTWHSQSVLKSLLENTFWEDDEFQFPSVGSDLFVNFCVESRRPKTCLGSYHLPNSPCPTKKSTSSAQNPRHPRAWKHPHIDFWLPKTHTKHTLPTTPFGRTVHRMTAKEREVGSRMIRVHHQHHPWWIFQGGSQNETRKNGKIKGIGAPTKGGLVGDPFLGYFVRDLPSFLLLSASVTKICSQKRFGSKKTVSTLISWTRWPFLPGISVCLRDVWKVETPINSWRDR